MNTTRHNGYATANAVVDGTTDPKRYGYATADAVVIIENNSEKIIFNLTEPRSGSTSIAKHRTDTTEPRSGSTSVIS